MSSRTGSGYVTSAHTSAIFSSRSFVLGSPVMKLSTESTRTGCSRIVSLSRLNTRRKCLPRKPAPPLNSIVFPESRWASSPIPWTIASVSRRTMKCSRMQEILLLFQLGGWNGLQIAVRSVGLLLDVVEVFVREDDEHVGLMFIQVGLRNNRNVRARGELVLLQRAVIDGERNFAGTDPTVITYRRHAC